MKILRIRCKANGTTIKFASEGTVATVVSDEKGSEALAASLQELKPVISRITNLVDSWLEKLEVTGLTVSPSGEANFKVVIVGKREMSVGSPLNLSTPIRFLYEGGQDQDDITKLALPSEHSQLVEKVLREAELYVQGLRPIRQLYLFDLRPGEGAVVDGEMVTPAPLNVTVEAPAKRKRGRPKKEKPVEQTEPAPVEAAG